MGRVQLATLLSEAGSHPFPNPLRPTSAPLGNDAHIEPDGRIAFVTQEVYDSARAELHDSTAREYRLKGFDEPVALYAA